MTTYKLRQQARIIYGNSHNARKWVRSILYLTKKNLVKHVKRNEAPNEII